MKVNTENLEGCMVTVPSLLKGEYLFVNSTNHHNGSSTSVVWSLLDGFVTVPTDRVVKLEELKKRKFNHILFVHSKKPVKLVYTVAGSALFFSLIKEGYYPCCILSGVSKKLKVSDFVEALV